MLDAMQQIPLAGYLSFLCLLCFNAVEELVQTVGDDSMVEEGCREMIELLSMSGVCGLPLKSCSVGDAKTHRGDSHKSRPIRLHQVLPTGAIVRLRVWPAQLLQYFAPNLLWQPCIHIAVDDQD
jgi:hypothetical protein